MQSSDLNIRVYRGAEHRTHTEYTRAQLTEASESERTRKVVAAERGTPPLLLTRTYIPLATTIEQRWCCPPDC